MTTHEARPAELLALLREQYGELMWGVVPRRTIVRQAEGAHAPVRAFGADGREVAEAYDRIAARVLDLRPHGSNATKADECLAAGRPW